VEALRILVLDDDPAMLAALERTLSGEGHAIMSLRSADDAINALLGGMRFDAIVSDVWMPTAGGDGMSFYERACRIAPDQAERIIFVTGGGLPARLRAFLVGRVVVNKPFRTSELLAVITRVAGRESSEPCAESSRG
jgi:CheY-like chemotaxis protein